MIKSNRRLKVFKLCQLDILIGRTHTQFTYNKYNIYESSTALLNQHTWGCVKKNPAKLAMTIFRLLVSYFSLKFIQVFKILHFCRYNSHTLAAKHFQEFKSEWKVKKNQFRILSCNLQSGVSQKCCLLFHLISYYLPLKKALLIISKCSCGIS